MPIRGLIKGLKRIGYFLRFDKKNLPLLSLIVESRKANYLKVFLTFHAC